MKNAIIKELTNRGFNAELTTVVKNGIEKSAIVIKSEDTNVSPTIYLDELTGTVEEITEKVVKIYESHRRPSINIDEIMTSDFFAKNLTVALQRISTEDIVKRPYLDDMEMYLLLRWGDMSIRIKPEHLALVKMDEENAWDIAFKNLNKSVTIRNMNEVMAEMLGIDVESINAMMGESPMFVISNKTNVKGASSILCTDKIKDFAKKNGVDRIAFIPSSIHEGIIVPMDRYSYSLDDLSQMVKEVNGSQVAPEEQLSDKAYVIEI